MDLGRAFKYGSIGALGVILSLSGTVGLSWVAWTDRISGQEGKAIASILLIAVAGVALSVIYLFIVIGEYIDQKLETQKLDHLKE